MEFQWCYRAEGNSSLVITNQKDHNIYRIRKAPKEAVLDGSSSQRATYEDVYAYMKYVIQPIIEGHFLPNITKVELSEDFIELVKIKVDVDRPLHRKLDGKQIVSGCAIQMPDYCFMHPTLKETNNPENDYPTISIELKPKMGFIPNSQHISAAHSIKHSTCRFCMYQRLKVKNEKVKVASSYCPIDLFSGNRKRMKFAFENLMRNPLNNLRVFKNGNSIFFCKEKEPSSEEDLKCFNECLSDGSLATGNNSRTASESLIDLITEILLKTSDSEEKDELLQKKSKIEQVLCSASRYKEQDSHHVKITDFSLPQNCILDLLLRAHKLDRYDIEGIYPLYERLQKHLQLHPEDRLKYSLDGPYNECWIKSDCCIDDKENASLDSIVCILRQYLIAATLKDCSIMITLKRINSNGSSENHGIISDSQGIGKYQFSTHLIDLDPKPSHRITRYFHLEKEIVENYLESIIHLPKNSSPR